MATEYMTAEVWLIVDECGDYACGGDEDAAAQAYNDNICEIDGSKGLRRVKVTVKVPLPAVLELAGEVTADETATGLTVAAKEG